MVNYERRLAKFVGYGAKTDVRFAEIDAWFVR